MMKLAAWDQVCVKCITYKYVVLCKQRVFPTLISWRLASFEVKFLNSSHEIIEMIACDENSTRGGGGGWGGGGEEEEEEEKVLTD